MSNKSDVFEINKKYVAVAASVFCVLSLILAIWYIGVRPINDNAKKITEIMVDYDRIINSNFGYDNVKDDYASYSKILVISEDNIKSLQDKLSAVDVDKGFAIFPWDMDRKQRIKTSINEMNAGLNDIKNIAALFSRNKDTFYEYYAFREGIDNADSYNYYNRPQSVSIEDKYVGYANVSIIFSTNVAFNSENIKKSINLEQKNMGEISGNSSKSDSLMAFYKDNLKEERDHSYKLIKIVQDYRKTYDSTLNKYGQWKFATVGYQSGKYLDCASSKCLSELNKVRVKYSKLYDAEFGALKKGVKVNDDQIKVLFSTWVTDWLKPVKENKAKLQ